MADADDENVDLYGILGVSRHANESEIKRAYHRLAKEYHPDKNPAAGDQFKEISFAYEILSNPEKKKIYDRHGFISKGLREGASGGGGFPGDIFGDLFGGFFGGGGHGEPFGFMGGQRGGRRQREGQDSVYPLKTSLEDMYNGKSTKIQLDKQVICSKCQGQGGKPGAMHPCRGCKGTGVKVTLRPLGPGMVQQMQSACNDCNGEGDPGEIINEKDRCKTCNGKKVIVEKKTHEVHIDKGMKNGQKIAIRGEGDQSPGVEPGDIIVVLQQEEHELFKRKYSDLHMVHTLGIAEALCGTSFVVKHLDGRDLVIRSPPGNVLEPDCMRAVVGEGMPIYRNPLEKGDLYIKFEIAFPPNKFSEEEKLKILETLLPHRPQIEIPQGEHVEEVNLMDFDQNSEQASGRREAYNEDEDGEPGGSRVQCAHQ